MIMALVEEGVRQRLRQRFSHLPEPVFNECLRTNPSNLDLCINQLRERSQAQAKGDPMCAVLAGMDPARLQRVKEPQDNSSLDGRLNSDGWVTLDWPPNMQPGGDGSNRPPNRTREAGEAQGGWEGYRALYKFQPPVQVSKLSVNLQDGRNRAQSPTPSQPSNSSSRRTDAGSGNRTPGTPDSVGLDTSILLPDISPPAPDRTPSPSINPFFPPIDAQALRASQSNGRSSPGVGYQAGSSSASPRHAHSKKNATPSTPASHYNSNTVVSKPPPVPAVVQPNVVVSSHPVAPHPLNSPPPGPDVRRKAPPRSPAESARWADPYTPATGGAYAPSGHGPSTHATFVPTSHHGNVPPQGNPTPQGSPAHQGTPAHQGSPIHQGPESPEDRQRMGKQEELAYNQALIMHQNARKDRLKKDLGEEQAKLERMRTEIQGMEQDFNTKRSSRSNFPSPDQLSKLREEKRQLQIDIECMNKEIELFRRQGLYYIDNNPQHFYKNITSGPTGPIPQEGPPAPMTVQPTVLDPDEGQQWNCAACTFLNHPFLDKCECCEMPRDNA